jgi:Skp family chaperone for outer membrane proteins
MARKLAAALVAAAAITALAAAPAGAASVAYIDGNNLWLSSPDGASKFQLYGA